MSVYVDDMEAPFGRMRMSHLMADTTKELLDMVDKIGVQRKWLQYPGTAREHFDIAISKKRLALEAGAIQVTWREIGIWSIVRSRWWPLHITFEKAQEQYASESEELLLCARERPIVNPGRLTIIK